MGFVCQREKKHNYFVHVLVRLQVQQAYAYIIEWCNVCVCIHACMHLAFLELMFNQVVDGTGLCISDAHAKACQFCK